MNNLFTILYALLVIAAFNGGFFLCHFISKKEALEEEQPTVVKRVRPSLKNPLQTYTSSYEQYKTKNGLYGPVQAKRFRVNEVSEDEKG